MNTNRNPALIARPGESIEFGGNQLSTLRRLYIKNESKSIIEIYLDMGELCIVVKAVIR